VSDIKPIEALAEQHVKQLLELREDVEQGRMTLMEAIAQGFANGIAFNKSNEALLKVMSWQPNGS
jgi:hypothetical protein